MKGQAYVMQLFSLLLTGLLAGSMAFILPGQVTKIQPAIDAKEHENLAVIAGNVLLAHPDLVYFDEEEYHRNIFDKEKLDDKLFTKNSGRSLFECSSFCSDFTFFPDSYGLVIIYDTENQEGWFSGLYTSSRLNVLDKESRSRFESCFQNKNAVSGFFQKDANIKQLINLDECSLKHVSSVLDRGFPVSIQYPNGERHTALLKVLVVE